MSQMFYIGGTTGFAGLTLHIILLYSQVFFHLETSVGIEVFQIEKKKKKIKVGFRPVYGRRRNCREGPSLLVTVGAPAEYVDVYIWNEHMHSHSLQREHIHRPYVHYFGSFVFPCIFIKLLTELF